MEKLNGPKTYDHRIEQFIDLTDEPLIEQSCNTLGVTYKCLFIEGQAYYSNHEESVFVPQGKAWIKMRANLPAGGNFDFVMEKVRELKTDQTIKSSE